jgi:hypothetical protein
MTLALVSSPTTGAPAVRPLAGTLPVRTFHPEGFFGTIQIDGQTARVAALATVEGKLLLASLVGYDTSVSAALAQLWQSKAVSFTPKTGVIWEGPQMLLRRGTSYKQFATKLIGTNEVHVVALSLDAHIGEGLLTPPAMARPDKEKPAQAEQSDASSFQTFPDGGPRFVLGNWDEEEPHQRAFLANLYAMRVILLHHRDPVHPERVDQWARELWERGRARRLVVPVETLGIKAWQIAGATQHWNQLIGQGVREGWLPWRTAAAQPLAEAA